MPSLKEFRDRIASVKSTRKITSAMKMVAASKLKRAQTQAEASQPYAETMANMLGRLVANTLIDENSPKLLAGSGKDDKHLLVVVTSDRGLCGGFNSYVAKKARELIKKLSDDGKEVSIICVGRKGRDILKFEFSDKIVEFFEGPGKKGLCFNDAQEIAKSVLDRFDAGEFDKCHLVYNIFKSVISQIPTTQQLIPFEATNNDEDEKIDEKSATGIRAVYEFEPTEEEILENILPLNVAVQIFRVLLDSAAGEQAARMTAMDNATRNSGEMISKLELTYNRARQAYITSELIEIISGAEAV